MKSIFANLLLVVYLFVSFYPVFHEEFAHDEETEQSCSIEEDLNPCHQAVFHAESSKACEHPIHLEADKHSCELCDFTFSQSQFHEFFAYASSRFHFAVEYNSAFTESQLPTYLTTHFSRGPPSSIFNIG